MQQKILIPSGAFVWSYNTNDNYREIIRVHVLTVVSACDVVYKSHTSPERVKESLRALLTLPVPLEDGLISLREKFK